MSLRNTIDIGIKPTIQNLTDTIAASIVNTDLFGNYVIDHVFVLEELFGLPYDTPLGMVYIKVIQESLDNSIALKEKDTQGYFLKESVYQLLKPIKGTKPYMYDSFIKGDLQQVSSETYALYIGSDTYEEHGQVSLTWKHPKDGKTVTVKGNASAIVILEKGQIIPNTGVFVHFDIEIENENINDDDDNGCVELRMIRITSFENIALEQSVLLDAISYDELTGFAIFFGAHVPPVTLKIDPTFLDFPIVAEEAEGSTTGRSQHSSFFSTAILQGFESAGFVLNQNLVNQNAVDYNGDPSSSTESTHHSINLNAEDEKNVPLAEDDGNVPIDSESEDDNPNIEELTEEQITSIENRAAEIPEKGWLDRYLESIQDKLRGGNAPDEYNQSTFWINPPIASICSASALNALTKPQFILLWVMHQKLSGNYPARIQANFPAVLTHRSGFSTKLVKILRPQFQNATGPHRMNQILRSNHTEKYGTIQFQYYDAMKDKLEEQRKAKQLTGNFSSATSYPEIFIIQ
ncbi:hypothetical protein INT47_010030 [Mucor saturninus]|uniref:Uncharacterized protein n=1 Tax=Mucor saturninus TaxID=64648 RepID=A0A8H7QPC7_9FUNG|nr:hypothetical protein INT47_010030 [Mucor saturninus]